MTDSLSFSEKLTSALAFNALRGVASLSLRANHGLASRVAFIMNLFSNRTRDVARTNIALCFPHLNEAEQQALAYESLVEAAKGSAEIDRKSTRLNSSHVAN